MALISSSNYLRCLVLILLSTSFLSIIQKSTSTITNDEPNYICPNTTLFLPNSKYQQNLNAVFQSLSSNATNPDGFYITDSGHNTKDAVYGIFLCRGVLNTSSCNDCVTTATTAALPHVCPNSKRAVIWYEECMVRYSDEPLYGKMAMFPAYILWKTSNVTVTRKKGFSEILNKAIDVVVNNTANNMSRKKFATWKVRITRGESLYTMAQCTPDLTVFDCIKCLIAASFDLRLSDGSSVLRPSCNLRYKTEPSFALLSTPPSLAPALTPVQAPTPAPTPAPAPAPEAANLNGRTTIPAPAATSPRQSASGKTTLSSQLNIIVGFCIFVIVNFYNHFI